MKTLLILIVGVLLPIQLLAETTVNININGKDISNLLKQLSTTEMIVGSGVEKKEIRNVNMFNGISMNIGGDVQVKYGKKPIIHIVADENILSMISTDVINGSLKISSTGSFSSKSGVKINIEVPNITSVANNGSGKITINSVAQNKLSISLNGSGSAKAIGSVADLSGKINGSGNLMLKMLKVSNCDMKINGSGTAFVSVANELSVKINGSGGILYYGEPKELTSKVNGSGSIRQGN